jgi:hypothetical protein
VPWWKRPSALNYDDDLWAVVFEFEVWLVTTLPPFEGSEKARLENADFDQWGKKQGWKRDPDWLRVAQLSVQSVRESSAWSHGDWARLGDRLLADPADRYAFGSLFGGVNVSTSTWYDGRHRALAQIDAGAQEIIVCLGTKDRSDPD